MDFPRVPFPKDLSTFQKLTNLGSQIRQIHLLESPTVEKYITQYPIDGDNVVVKPTFVKVLNFDKGNLGKVYINDIQYFDSVPQIAWDFYIPGIGFTKLFGLINQLGKIGLIGFLLLVEFTFS
ncbi:MAG: hypothetical protein NDI80_02275 [Flavobacteriaceae bacterium]|nr:hypothetical protein [Flavobacteriaceae bacterium]